MFHATRHLNPQALGLYDVAMSTDKHIKPIAIFKPGRFTAMNGQALEFSDADVAAIAAHYQPSISRAPLVLGHPEHNSPAYGWVQSVNYADNLLSVMPEAVNPEFADWVNQGYYQTVSASLYQKDHPNNPTPGHYYLRHVGFLGGNPPAVKGLPPPEFSDELPLITLEFTERFSMAATTESVPTLDELRQQREALQANADALKQKEAEFAEKEQRLNTDILALAAEKQSAHKHEMLAFAEELVKAGRVLPKDKAALVEFMASLKPDTVLEFGEGETKIKTALLTWFKSFMSGLSKQVEFGEVSGVDKATGQPLSNQQIAQRARVYYQKMHDAGNTISFADAVDAVNAELDKGV